MELREVVKRYYDLGLNIVLLRNKRPLHKWQHLLKQRQSQEEFEALPWGIADQFAVVCGLKANNGLHTKMI